MHIYREGKETKMPFWSSLLLSSEHHQLFTQGADERKRKDSVGRHAEVLEEHSETV